MDIWYSVELIVGDGDRIFTGIFCYLVVIISTEMSRSVKEGKGFWVHMCTNTNA